MTEITKGQVFVLKQEIRRRAVGGYYAFNTFPEGTEMKVTKVSRFGSFWVRGYSEDHGGDITIQVNSDEIETLFNTDPNFKIRKMGEVPEDGISPDDPRLSWLWEDAAKLANQKGHCSTYDSMCDTLGIPGRERDFTITRDVNGLKASFKVKARSRKLAEAQVEASLAPTEVGNV